ncbi:MAG: bacteriohopanetetrol glucosamine biosynthesis glycosyltransferase HpnI [Acidobacteriota bacterium]|nr:bacteriohopanetetrol glucosamine biosynthesis glycosyltransferase HpnI [Acidobacteriota bacterium]
MALSIEVFTTLLTVGGLVYMLLALWSARDFGRLARRMRGEEIDGPRFAPDVSILKPVKGVDPRMYGGLASHCRQTYAGQYEILFAVSDLADPAVAVIQRLQAEFPSAAIRVVECRERLGTSGKVSNLVQAFEQAQYPYVLINDSDIRVSPHYLTRVMRCFGADGVGMVTAPYLGRTAAEGAALTVWARLEALGISTDFLPGVLTARKLEGGIRFGLGSTLAVSRAALEAAGGLAPLVEYLADDYELGARVAAAGFRVELSAEVVETTVPAYTFRGFLEHQLRWARSTRDSRRLGYLGLGISYAVPWAMLNCVATGFELWSFSLLSLVLLARVAVALSVGVGVLNDPQVLRDLCLLPVRDWFGLIFWAWSFASDEVVWRGERFRLRQGRIVPAGGP